jgi:histone-lysine N-methyltransferase SETMAR
MQYKHSTSSATKKFKVTTTPSAGTVMFTEFWDSQELLLAHFQKRGENVKSSAYCEVLLKRRDVHVIRRKPPGQLEREVLLHHDPTRPHTAVATQERIQELQWELLQHPPYSPHLASNDFHLFGPLKNTLVANVLLTTKRLKRWCRSG